MQPINLFAATGTAVARIASGTGDVFSTSVFLEGSGAQAIAVDPADPDRVYVGTFNDGVYRTLDGGTTWAQVGGPIPHKRVLSVAFSPAHRVNGRSAVYVGTEPSMLFRSEDDGRTWRDFPHLTELPSSPTWSFPPRPWTHHVRWIAPDHHDPALLFVGIELGGVICSRDGGATWEDRKAGSYHDSHAIATHATAQGRVYEAAGGGVALSLDAGASWTPVDEGMDRHYVWGLAVDPADPELWYVSASLGPGHAHGNQGDAAAIIFRKRGDAPWEPLGGPGTGLPAPSPSMPYALLVPREQPGTLVAGLQHGELMVSRDAGERWQRVSLPLSGLLALSEAA